MFNEIITHKLKAKTKFQISESFAGS